MVCTLYAISKAVWGGRGKGVADKLGWRLITRLIVLTYEVGGALTSTSQG